MDGKISEIIDNVIDTDIYLKDNKQENINSINSWNQLTYLDVNLIKKEKDQSLSPNQNEKTKETKTEINKNSINIINDKKEKKVLNENLFKGKGFRSNIDFFLKNNSETLSLSGITDIFSLAEYPNVFTCIQPRPGTNRYKKANKSANDSFYNAKIKNKSINLNNMNMSTTSINKKFLPKIKNSTEERKNPINKVVISAKNKNK